MVFRVRTNRIRDNYLKYFPTDIFCVRVCRTFIPVYPERVEVMYYIHIPVPGTSGSSVALYVPVPGTSGSSVRTPHPYLEFPRVLGE